jgi:hypothetical protein
VAATKMNSGHQLRICFDANKILQNALIDNRKSYELYVDYYLRKERYLVAELGLGNSQINYTDLKYNSKNSFVKFGMDKAMFVRKKAQDWGMGFVGFRYGIGFVRRSEAQYTTNDGFGGITSGYIPSSNFLAHWIELTGGIRVELIKNIFAGWNVRAKILLNPNSFGDLKPSYISGFGAGDKNTVFDYNVYVGYALRWSSKK